MSALLVPMCTVHVHAYSRSQCITFGWTSRVGPRISRYQNLAGTLFAKLVNLGKSEGMWGKLDKLLVFFLFF